MSLCRSLQALLVAAACLSPTLSHAQEFSPERLGAFAGAMRYCEERLPGSDARYRRARLGVAREFDGMSRQEKRRAIAARDRAFERGRFLGERLDAAACRRLVRAGEWHRFAGR
jgi:hypothetical protein